MVNGARTGGSYQNGRVVFVTPLVSDVQFQVYAAREMYTDHERDIETEKQLIEALRTLIRYFRDRNKSLHTLTPNMSNENRHLAQQKTFRCEKSGFAGMGSYRVEMKINDKGIYWRYLEDSKSEYSIPWNDVVKWSPYGETAGYALDLSTEESGSGGTFRFRRSDLAVVCEMFNKYAAEKSKANCKCNLD